MIADVGVGEAPGYRGVHRVPAVVSGQTGGQQTCLGTQVGNQRENIQNTGSRYLVVFIYKNYLPGHMNNVGTLYVKLCTYGIF